jgi:hypothetical protein
VLGAVVAAPNALGALAQQLQCPIELVGDRPEAVVLLPIALLGWDHEQRSLLTNESLDAGKEIEVAVIGRQIGLSTRSRSDAVGRHGSSNRRRGRRINGLRQAPP